MVYNKVHVKVYHLINRQSDSMSVFSVKLRKEVKEKMDKYRKRELTGLRR